MKSLIALSFVLLTHHIAWAAPVPVFDNAFADMTYPSTAGNYLVYSQRVGQSHQIMQVKKDHLYGAARDVSAISAQDMVRYGVALENGDMAYVSNRTNQIIPWLKGKTNIAIQAGLFTGVLTPNHLDVSADGHTWVFDSTLETSRILRIRKQFLHPQLPSELLGQGWRLYHEKLWIKKPSYPATTSGMSNTFAKPHLFVFQRGTPELTMLGDGFDASLSADGTWMVFVREDHGNFDLWKQNIDGTGLQRLTKSSFADVEPDISPDGQKVVFVSNRDSRGDVLQTFIHVLDLKSGNIQSITSGMGTTDGGPAWLDNHTIIFHSNRDPQSPDNGTVDNWRLWQVALPK